MKRELEALLFATESPLTLARLKKIFPEAETADLKAAVAELEAEYSAHEHAFSIIEFGGGYQIATKPEFSPIVEKMLKTRRFTRLSKAGLEVLAIIAYKQPLTRLEVDEIRGVNSSGAISTLTERNLITVVGRSQAVGNPLLYGTTREFLNHLGLRGLGQLPDLPDLEQVMDDRDELKQFASLVGRDVSDQELEDYFTAPVAADVPEGEEGDVAEEVTDEVAEEVTGEATEESTGEEGGDEVAEPAAEDNEPLAQKHENAE
ncbi:MAG: SMC-Scp complex subunit ScpB [Candidatus Krumholzibacteria bacterium]|nr:SMC-Scp complex subunit ScpB [Candidatus Krumholzibacteria bacterium]